MQKRNPIAVALLPLVTFGIYGIYWSVKTKGEMNARGADIPTAWLIIVPLVNIWWMWKYSEGVEHVTGGKMQAVIAFLLLWLLGSIGAAIVQNSFNVDVADEEPVAPASMPDVPTPTPSPTPIPPPPAAPSAPRPTV